MHKLSESITRTEALLNDLERSMDVKDILRVGNEYSQIIYLLRKLETEGCAMVTAFGPVSLHIPSELTAAITANQNTHPEQAGRRARWCYSGPVDAGHTGLSQCIRHH
jgi:hypothetical protein